MTKAELIVALQADVRPDDYPVEVEVYIGCEGRREYPDVWSIGGYATDGYICLVAR